MNQGTEVTTEDGSNVPEGGTPTNPEWDAMNDLLRKVVRVPKDEYDRRDAEYKLNRQKAKP